MTTPHHRMLLALRGGLLRCAALLATAAALAFAVRDMAVQTLHTDETESARQTDLQARLSRAGDATQTQRDDAHYRALLAAGVIGPERRLDWIQRIAQLKEQRLLVGLHYELAPQHALPGALKTMAGGHEFMASTMTLQMSLLHEEDLLGFLDELAVTAPALLRVRHCNVERIVAADAADAAQLRADCRIDWITLRDRL